MRIELALIVATAIIGCSTDPSGTADTFSRDAYPTGPYAKAEGGVVENHAFIQPDGTTLSLQELRADESSSLLLIVTAAGWCTACIEEQPSLQALFDEHHAQGLRIVVTIFEDAEFAPAIPSDAGEWQRDYALSFPVVADPEFQLSEYYDASLTPMNMLVDIGPMTIERITTGWDPTLIESLVEALL